MNEPKNQQAADVPSEEPADPDLIPEIADLLRLHLRVSRQRPDQLVVTRIELGGHWAEFGSPSEKNGAEGS